MHRLSSFASKIEFFYKQKKDNRQRVALNSCSFYSVLYVLYYSYVYNLLLIFVSCWDQIKRPVDKEKWHCHLAQCTLKQGMHLEVIRDRGCCCTEHPAAIFVRLWNHALSFCWVLIAKTQDIYCHLLNNEKKILLKNRFIF